MKLFRAAAAIIITLVITACFATVTAFAGSAVTLKVSGTYYYDSAQNMLKLVNAERSAKGVGALTLDKELTAAAMQRAAEISVDFNHYRPNGELCFTVSNKAGGENIAANGSLNASGAFEQWKNSSGHYANMISEDFQSIGIGVFSSGGYVYWVQLFGWDSASQTETKNSKTAVTANVDVLTGSSSLYFSSGGKALKSVSGYTASTNTYSTKPGSVISLEVCRANPGWNQTYATFDASGFSWTSSNTAAAAVDANGKVTAKAEGTAVITAASKNGSEKLTLNVKVAGTTVNISKAQVTLSQTDFTYDGSAKTPSVTVKYNGKALRNGTDYTVSYTDNTNAGTASVTVTGKGSYTGSVTKNFTIDPRPTVTTKQTTVTTRQTTTTTTAKKTATTTTTTAKETTVTSPKTTTASKQTTTRREVSETVIETEIPPEAETETEVSETLTSAEEQITSQSGTVTSETTAAVTVTEAEPSSEEQTETTPVAEASDSGSSGLGTFAIIAVCAAGAALLAAIIAKLIRKKQ
ncbi:MAG: Ig-like domain-containing protein [Ruminococcus sp.]|nr:Ig-like domain-containing protein [Ruminococcus sp.]